MAGQEVKSPAGRVNCALSLQDGARDPIVPVRHAYLAAERIPNCQVRIFQDSGHSVYRQRIREFSDVLVRFLG